MAIEILSRRENLLIRRQTLLPGEATHWHVDRCHRFSVVVCGEKLALEFRDGESKPPFDVHPGMSGWDAPEPRTHRAINVGTITFEEVVIYLLERAEQDPQPEA